MAIQVGGTTVINDSRQLQNIGSVDSTTKTNLVSGLISGDNNASASVKGDGSGGIFFAGEQIGVDTTKSSGSGTYTVPSGAAYIKVFVTGGGAGGGGANACSSSWFHSGGGGAGGTMIGFYAVTPGDTISYVVGGFGTGGVGQANGTAGANSTLTKSGTTFATGFGGSANSTSTGGAGGSATHSGMVNTTASTGGTGQNGGAEASFKGGNGGASYYGSGGNGGHYTHGSAPAGVSRGAGGGGAGINVCSNRNGGQGQGGSIVIQAWTGLG